MKIPMQIGKHGLTHEFNEIDNNNLQGLTPFVYPSTGAATGSKESVDEYIEHQITHACHENTCADRKTWIMRWI
jgi:hypothetical protein